MDVTNGQKNGLIPIQTGIKLVLRTKKKLGTVTMPKMEPSLCLTMISYIIMMLFNFAIIMMISFKKAYQ